MWIEYREASLPLPALHRFTAGKYLRRGSGSDLPGARHHIIGDCQYLLVGRVIMRAGDGIVEKDQRKLQPCRFERLAVPGG